MAFSAVPRKLNEDFGSSADSSTHPGKLTDAVIRVQKYENSRCGLGCFQQGIGYKINCLADSLYLAPQCFVVHTVTYTLSCVAFINSHVWADCSYINLCNCKPYLLEYNRPVT